MGILLSWKLILLASILGLTSFASSESPNLLIRPTSSDTRQDKPLPIKLSSVQHESLCINIYDSQTTKNSKTIYFYSPMALLRHLNVASINNQTGTHGTLSVTFSIWNPELRKKVAQHLTQLLSQQIELDQVQVFDFNSIRLTSKEQSADFSLTNEWLPYANQLSLRFTLICPTREDCDRVKTQLRISPKEFEHLRLAFKPKLNDDDCFIDGVGVSIKESEFPVQLKESLANLEAKFAKELISIKEETKRDFEANSRLAAKIKVTEENLAVVQKKLEITEKELEATKTLLTATRIELSNTKSIVDDLSQLTTKLNANSQRLDHKLKATEDNLRKELSATLSHLETATTNLDSTRTELNSTNVVVADFLTQLNARTRPIVDTGKMPTSCDDLQQIGHKLSGFFSVKGSKKMEMVYCDFYPNQNDLQKWIGYADVKSAPVYFYVQRNSSFVTTKTPIPFELARVNEGNGMDLTSGIFTAPRPGTYFFSFTGMAKFSNSSTLVGLGVVLYLNGGQIGLGYVEEANTIDNQWSPLTLQSTLNLKKGDRIWVQIDFWTCSCQFLSDNENHNNHFTGFMLEEEIVESL